jgi:methyl-accepting chemotaxis protein
MGALIAELGTAQQRAADAAAQLDTAMQTLDTGHAEIVRSLSDILGNLQFQDVMRQRLEQIFGALRELEDLIAQSTSGAPPTRSLLDVLEQQRARYVMESQRQVHGAIVNDNAPAEEADAAPAARIELF